MNTLGIFTDRFTALLNHGLSKAILVGVLEDAEVIIQRFIVKLAIPRQIGLCVGRSSCISYKLMVVRLKN